MKRQSVVVTLLCLAGSGIFSGCGGTEPADPSSGTGGSSQTGGTGGAPGAGGSGVGGSQGQSGTQDNPGGGGQGGTSSASGGAGGGGAGGTTTTGSGGAGGTSAPDGGGQGGTPVVDGGMPFDAGALDKFSFFVTSMVAMRTLSKSMLGFGGDLRYGQADGLAGADKICTDIAESSMPGSGAKQWRAFLSTTKGVNAADRIGKGPWYDRRGRVVAMTLTDLLQNRPGSANAAIKEDLPNETGTPNHRPDPTKPEDDNHHTLTGSDAMGKLYGPKATCLDWTSSARDNVMTGRPRIGFSWSIMNRTNWISGQDEGGCGAGVAVEENPGSDPTNPIVGSGGGYGGIYCFALTP